MGYSIQFRYQNQVVSNLLVIVKYWHAQCIVHEEHHYSDAQGRIILNHLNDIQICIDARSPFKDFKLHEIDSMMVLQIDSKRSNLLMNKLAYCISFYHQSTACELDALYRIYQKIMGIEEVPIHHYFVLSIVNQMYLELQKQ